MTEQDETFSFKKGVLKVAMLFTALTFIFFLLAKLENNKILNNKTIVVGSKEAQKQIVDSLAKDRIILRDSLVKEIRLRDSINGDLVVINKKLSEQVKYIKNQKIVIPKESQEMAQYFNTRYDTVGNMVSNNKVSLTYSTTQYVISDLSNFDKEKSINFLYSRMLVNKDTIISNKDKNILDFKSQLAASEKEISERKKHEAVIMNELELTDKHRKRNKWIAYIAVPVAFFLGTQLTN